jgi:hypothetical protein
MRDQGGRQGGSSSVGRASAFQAEGRGFDPRFPLHCFSTPGLVGIADTDFDGLSGEGDRFLFSRLPT